ncbi:porin [Robbsia sp. KACC 23696]|uniref:porin n=1 Tax=Robbsia sp. KACC 23696 TaxID=3149231 RepID=UPI00325A6639
MKKTLMAAALAGASAFAINAHAQSSVTLYGTLDAGLVYLNNAGTGASYSEGSGNVSNTYWGLRGNEDLGGGLHAIFTLEDGFNLNNGASHESGSQFNRQAYVGLKSDQYGTLTLGRQYSSAVDFLGPLSATGQGYGNNLAAHPLNNDDLDAISSIKNAVKYRSANYYGFEFGGLYGFSNQANGFSNNRAYSAGVSYNNGPLSAAASYLQLNNGGTNTTGATSLGNGSATVAANLQRTFGAGLNYTFGPATLGFVYTNTHLDGLGGVELGGTTFGGLNGSNLHLSNYEVNGRYALTPALNLSAAYTFTDGKASGFGGTGSPKWQQVSLQSDYSLSKRTDVYLEGVYQKATGSLGNNAATGVNYANRAAIGTSSPSSTGNQVAVTVGLRHRF